MHDLLPLQLLATGQQGEISQRMGSTENVRRLEEMGLREGAAIEMVQSGTPCIVRVAGHKLCFREGEALSVLVRAARVAS